jgi:hypothetical protein
VTNFVWCVLKLACVAMINSKSRFSMVSHQQTSKALAVQIYGKWTVFW